MTVEAKNLSVTTNQNMGPEDLVYRVLRRPDSTGHLLLLEERTETGMEVAEFTQADLDGGRLLFSALTRPEQRTDWFALMARAGDLETPIKV